MFGSPVRYRSFGRRQIRTHETDPGRCSRLPHVAAAKARHHSKKDLYLWLRCCFPKSRDQVVHRQAAGHRNRESDQLLWSADDRKNGKANRCDDVSECDHRVKRLRGIGVLSSTTPEDAGNR